MTREQLIKLLVAAARRSAVENFSVEDVNSAAIKAFREYFKLSDDDLTSRMMKRLSAEHFDIIEEVVEMATPQAVEDIIGAYAEVQTLGRNDHVIFYLRNQGARRIKQGIVPGARAGIYRARRIDNMAFELPTAVETVAYALSLEDLLTGRVTIADYVSLITAGFVEKVYIKMLLAFRQAAALSPANFKHSSSGDLFSIKNFDAIIRRVAAFGTPTIIGFESQLDHLANVGLFETYTPNRAARDLDDIRDYGRILKYKGRNIVVLPNYLTDANEWYFRENDVYIVPSDEKPVKVAFKGQLTIQEVQIPSGGVEYHAHRDMGVGVVVNGNIGVYTNTDTDALLEGLY